MKKATWPSDTLSVYRETLNWAVVSMLPVNMTSILSWEYMWGVCQQCDWLDWQSDALQEGLWEKLWEGLQLGLQWQHDCLSGDLLERHPLCLLELLQGFWLPLLRVLQVCHCLLFFSLHRAVKWLEPLQA